MTIKQIAAAAVAVIGMSVAVQAGTPPTVMFLPDKTWCSENGFIEESTRGGKTRYTEKFDEAFMRSTDLKNVVVQLNGLMKDNGIPPKDYGTSSELDDEEDAEMELLDGEDGMDMELTPYEQAMQKLRPDIIIYIGWDVNKVGFNYTISYRLEAKDSYTGKSIAQVTAETPTTKATVAPAAALKAAATEHMPQFISRLQDHFDDLQENGREVTLLCQIGNNGSGVTMESDINGKELSTIISDWMNDNTVNHAYSTRSSGKNRISFEQVRIPFKDANGRVMQAKEFADQLRNHLKTFGIDSKNRTKGLGSGRITHISGQ